MIIFTGRFGINNRWALMANRIFLRGAIILFVCLLRSSSQLPLALPASLPMRDAGRVIYLPILLRSNPINVVVTYLNGYPQGMYYYALGYVENADSVSFEVTLVADVTVYPFPAGGTPTPPTTTTVLFKPALDVTVPGQRNPFSLLTWCYKGCYVTTGVRVAQVIPLGSDRGTYLPLTVADWLYKDGALTGVVRNDSSQALDNARVVATGLVNPEFANCAWKEAALETVNLQPGQETTFTIDPYSYYCTGDQLLIVGQGHAP
jgi:hypothetical protein